MKNGAKIRAAMKRESGPNNRALMRSQDANKQLILFPSNQNRNVRTDHGNRKLFVENTKFKSHNAFGKRSKERAMVETELGSNQSTTQLDGSKDDIYVQSSLLLMNQQND